MSDEDDYMSDAILQQCNEKVDKEIRLNPNKISKKYEQEKKQKERKQKNIIKPKKVLESEKREEMLSKSSLTTDNKGFNLLQKMGFKQGMVLGKHGTGRAEPVPINLKLGRGGLGQEEHQKRKQNEKVARWAELNIKRQKLEKKSQESFVQNLRQKYSSQEDERDLRKSQKVCEQLDSQQGVTEPSELFFWPHEFLKKKKSKRKSEDENHEVEGKEEYCYELDDDDDEDADDDDIEEEEEDDSLTVNEKLEIITLYLRNKYLYCIWCATSYNDSEDLKSNCPGNTADDHD